MGKHKNPETYLFNIVLFISIRFCLGSVLSGNVIDSETDQPISGVRVSVGYTDTVTYTDESGYFSFEESSVQKKGFLNKVQIVRIRKLINKSILDLSSCRSVNRVRVFDVNGRCIFRKKVSDFNRLVSLPDVSNGMYIVQLFSDDSKYAMKWNSVNTTQKEIFRAEYNKKHLSSETAGNKTIVFQNDWYYPRRISTEEISQAVYMEPDPRAVVFDDTRIGRYDFIMEQTDSLSMEQNARLEEYVPAGFLYNDVSYGKVGLRYKGSVYSLPNCFEEDGTRKDKPECKKISLKIKFNKFVDDTRFYKMKRLNLHSESVDPSMMNDILSYGLFREMGIIAPRCAFAKVFINGVFQGLFCAVEAIDGRFTKARWPEHGDGNLYKEKWPVTNSLDYYENGLKTNDNPEDSADVSKMVRFFEAVSSSDLNTFKNDISPFWDFDYWLHYIAADRVIHNSDGIMTWYIQENWSGNHNYFFYQEEAEDGKLWIIPWDLHVTFDKKDPIIDALGVPDWNVAPPDCEPVTIWGEGKGMPAHCDKLIGMTADLFWNDFVKVSEKMLKTCFDVDHLQKKVDTYKELIDQVIKEDPHVDYDSWSWQVQTMRNDIAVLNSDFEDYIYKRSVVNDTDAYLEPFDGIGYLDINQCNNFEFVPTGNENKWSYYMSASNTSITLLHDTTDPLWGTADLHYSFVFDTEPGDGMYKEWGNMVLKFENAQDLSKLQQIQVNLKSDSNREFWFYITSPQYSKNDVTVQYGWWDGTLPEDSLRVFKMNSINYPTWATGKEPDILEDVLSNATGIGFQSNPRFGSDGELANAPDSGFLRIDNVRFIFE